MVGLLVRHVETARFARVLGALLEGGVALPVAMGIAARGIGNQHIAEAVAAVTAGLKQGEGLAGPLAQAKVFPRLAIGFLRTGEETSQLALMSTRLADVLDREVRLRLDGLMAILTPAITIGLGGMVALVIAAILSAILGFNDVALAS
jgi:general secretion pathway protein F